MRRKQEHKARLELEKLEAQRLIQEQELEVKLQELHDDAEIAKIKQKVRTKRDSSLFEINCQRADIYHVRFISVT